MYCPTRRAVKAQSGAIVFLYLHCQNAFCDDEEALWEAISLCGLEALIRPHKNGLDAVIIGDEFFEHLQPAAAEEYLHLSLGEQQVRSLSIFLPLSLCFIAFLHSQLFCFCRAFLRRSPLVILDEAFAVLDAANKIRIKNIIGRFRKWATVLIFSQDLGDIRPLCDQVMSLSGGQTNTPLEVNNEFAPAIARRRRNSVT